jgi:hypothetical protein
VLKRKFKILSTTAEYSINTQVDLIFALTGLHNFVRLREGGECFLDIEDTDKEVVHRPARLPSGDKGSAIMNEKRELIAQAMWTDYQRYLVKGRVQI